VTHDQEEAMEVADRIVVMNKGVIEQIGSPGEGDEQPANEFVYHLLGDSFQPPGLERGSACAVPAP